MCLITISIPLSAQNKDSGKDSYLTAEEAYRDGQLSKAIGILETNMKSYDHILIPNVYRLLALCYMAVDQEEKTNECVKLLLRYAPYYTVSLQDPERFADMIRKYKEGKATLVTASQQAETLEETPVPVILITEEMIKAIAADNLKDVLTTYVPGITAIEGNSELNISMHGVYSSSQDKILIMLNGHRLNSRSTNAQAPDYSISMEKIKQIEVLRGPASSLYGNAALTAVINIITKEGKDVDGASISIGTGSFGSYKADFLVGKHGPETDFIAWASVYSSEGQKIFYPAGATDVWRLFPIDGYAYINGFNHNPAFDIGGILQWNDHWKIYANHQYAKMQSPYTYVVMQSPYTYEKYRRLNGQKPGHGRTSWRGEIQYNTYWKDYSVDINAYFDMDQQMNYEVDGDSLPPVFDLALPPDEILDSIHPRSGFYQMTGWNEYTYGVSVKSSYSYGKDADAHGTLLIGLQCENYTLRNEESCLGDNYDRILITNSEHNAQLKKGHELSLSAFLQGKHYFTPNLIVNGGIRYDYKYRFNRKTLHAVSPRLACIYKNDNWSFKLSYARSFVDAPFFYRANTVKTYRGSEDLQPEYLDAIQLSTTFLSPLKHLTYDCNVYYNRLNGLIYYERDIQEDKQVYSNAGSLKLIGIENNFSYNASKINVTANLTYQRMLSADKYPVSGHKVNSIPAVVVNLVLSRIIFSSGQHSLWIHGRMNYYSSQNMPVSGYKDGVNYQDLRYKIKGTVIPGISLDYQYGMLACQLSCNNLFDTYYTRGSLYNIDVPQSGRNIFCKIKFSF